MHLVVRLTAPALLVLAATLPALAQEELVGRWQGTLEAGPQRLPLVIEIAREGGTWSAALDSPHQGVRGMPFEAVEVAGAQVTLTLAAAGASFTASLQDGKLAGTWNQAGASFPLVLERVVPGGADLARPERPQEPKPPFPYDAVEVSWRHRDGALLAPGAAAEGAVTLAGTLTRPRGEGPFPAAILVTGSGLQDRDETLLGHRPFLVLADHLTRLGFCVLRYDDRGVGGSSGPPTETTPDIARDALAAWRFLRAQAKVDPERVGVIGHSEGALIGPTVANEEQGVAFLVLLAGPGVPGAELLAVQSHGVAAASGATPEQLRLTDQLNAELYAAAIAAESTEAARASLEQTVKDWLATLSPDERAVLPQTDEEMVAGAKVLAFRWFRHFLAYDPRPALRELRCPVLALGGGHDLQVDPAQNLPAIAGALAEGGNEDHAVIVLPRLNHLFQTSPTGAPSEYAAIEETFAPLALRTLSDWLRARFVRE